MQERVLHVINNLNVSGASTLLLDLANAVQPQPGQLAVCTLEPDNPLAGALRSAGAEVIEPEHNLKLAQAIAHVRSAIASERPALVHTHLLPATQVGLAAALMESVPAVTTVHFTLDSVRANFLLRRVNRASYRFYQRVIAISQAVRESILNNCAVPSERVVVVHNGVDFTRNEIGPGMREAARRKLGIRDGEILIGTVGRLDPAKGHRVLLEAAAQLAGTCSRIRLMLVGDGPERGPLEHRASRLGMADIVTFAGTQADPAPYMAAFDVFVLPSISEGLGLSLIEAMGAGLPVVASNAGGIPEVVSDGETGLLFCAGDASELASCIGRIIDDESYRVALAYAGSNWVRSRFDIYGHAARLYAEYAAIVGEPVQACEVYGT